MILLTSVNARAACCKPNEFDSNNNDRLVESRTTIRVVKKKRTAGGSTSTTPNALGVIIAGHTNRKHYRRRRRRPINRKAKSAKQASTNTKYPPTELRAASVRSRANKVFK
jgi:hypothetical protein